MKFANRRDAGQQLARQLKRFSSGDVVVLGLPRGGVPVASEVAEALRVPLDVILVRKLGVPWQQELAMGAIGEGNVRVINEQVVESCGITRVDLDAEDARERKELQRRVGLYRQVHEPLRLTGKTVLIVDDGIATGSTVLAACRVARARGASWIVVAVPVAPLGWDESLEHIADECIALHTPDYFDAVGRFYRDFAQVTDDVVLQILSKKPSTNHRPVSEDVEITLDDGVTLRGHLEIPAQAKGCVVFVHGSGSSRKSPRNIHVATILNAGGLATLLFDLLSEDESDRRENVFDINLLSRRLADVTTWLRLRHDMSHLGLAYFGASTGAAAALSAAARNQDIVAVVSRGGRPDLALDDLDRVQCPVLLIVGSRDVDVRLLNEEAAAQLKSRHRIAIVQRASHLFEEPGTLDEAAHLARDFFLEEFATTSLQSTQAMSR